MYMDSNLPLYGKSKHVMNYNEKARCFVLLAKFTGSKGTQEETFAKRSQISSFKQELEGLSTGHSNHVVMKLFHILEVQEVGSTEEYHVNGFLVKVHVLEDTDLWTRLVQPYSNSVIWF